MARCLRRKAKADRARTDQYALQCLHTHGKLDSQVTSRFVYLFQSSRACESSFPKREQMFVHQWTVPDGFAPFRRAELQNDRPETYLRALEQHCLNQPYNLVLCVLSNNRKDRYDALKKFLCMDTAIPSQVRDQQPLFIGIFWWRMRLFRWSFWKLWINADNWCLWQQRLAFRFPPNSVVRSGRFLFR